MRQTFEALPDADKTPRLRMITGFLSLVAALTLGVTLGAQIIDLVRLGRFSAFEFVSYFSIQFAFISFVGLLLTGLAGFSGPRDTPRVASVRSFLALNAFSVIITHTTLFSQTPANASGNMTALQWPDVVLHIIIPGYLVVDWILNPLRARIPRWVPFVSLLYPIGWIIGTYIVGRSTGWYVNPLLDPASDVSPLLTALYLGAIGVTLALMALMILMINRIHYRLVPGNLFES